MSSNNEKNIINHYLRLQLGRYPSCEIISLEDSFKFYFFPRIIGTVDLSSLLFTRVFARYKNKFPISLTP
jgi:hypothetical protein